MRTHISKTSSAQRHQSPARVEQKTIAAATNSHLGCRAADISSGTVQPEGKNLTGLSDRLKRNLERLSGLDLSATRVHRNSDRPLRIGALAYTKGTDIFLGPGQERHLAHESWHVVQQLQKRVKPLRTLEMGSYINDDPALEREAEAMSVKIENVGPTVKGMQAAPSGFTSSLVSAPIQGVWARVEGEGEGKINLRTLKKDKLYTYNGENYEFVGRDKDDVLVVKKLAGQLQKQSYKINKKTKDQKKSPEYKFADYNEELKDWAESDKPSTDFQTRYGLVHIRDSRKAPFIQSNRNDYNDTKVGDDYNSMIQGLVNGNPSASNGKNLAHDLLGGIVGDHIKTDEQKQAAAKLAATVGMAEDWRKHGAPKEFRGILAAVEEGELSFGDIPQAFAFVESADSGRRQIGRLQDVINNDIKFEELPKTDQIIYENLSPTQNEDVSSEEGMRKKKKLKKRRLYSQKHKENPG